MMILNPLVTLFTRFRSWKGNGKFAAYYTRALMKKNHPENKDNWSFLALQGVFRFALWFAVLVPAPWVQPFFLATASLEVLNMDVGPLVGLATKTLHQNGTVANCHMNML